MLETISEVGPALGLGELGSFVGTKIGKRKILDTQSTAHKQSFIFDRAVNG